MLLDDLVGAFLDIRLVVRIFFLHPFHNAIDQDIETGFTACLVRVLQTGTKLNSVSFADLLDDFLVVFMERHFAFRLTGFGAEFIQRGALRRDDFLCNIEGFQHHGF